VHEHGRAAGTGYLPDRFLSAAVVDVGHHDPGSLARQVLCNATADA
jgi:hypothetical protein